MATEKIHPVMTKDIDAGIVASLSNEIKRQLDAKRDAIYHEIRQYPPPIPACDQQFNYLLEQRTAVAQELRRLDGLRREDLPPDHALDLLTQFVRSSTFVDDKVLTETE